MKKENEFLTDEQIKELNTYFKSLSPSEQRVAIAKDVIENVKAKICNASQGDYFTLNTKHDPGTSLQKVIPTVECHVCALGAMFVSEVKYNNQFNTNGNAIAAIKSHLPEYFKIGQLALIESAFEGFTYEYNTELDDYALENGLYMDETLDDLRITTEEVEKAVAFYRKYEDSNERLIAIMENIIANNGKFALN